MKKIVSLMLVLAMTFALGLSITAFPAAGELGTAPAAASAPAVDGAKDSLYDDALVVPIDKNLSPTMPFTEAYGTAYFVHHDEMLYAYIEVSDEDFFVDENAAKAWYMDCVEICINEKNSDSKYDIMQYRIDAKGYPSIWDRTTDTRAEGTDCDQYGFLYAEKNIEGGYAVEFGLPCHSNEVGIGLMIYNWFTDGTSSEQIVLENQNGDKVQMNAADKFPVLRIASADAEPAADEPAISGKIEDGKEALPFTDVPADAAYVEAVKYCYENGYMNGTSDTEFTPDKELNRATIVTVLYRLEGQPEAAYTGKFTDVADGQWYTAAIEWAAANGIVNGVADDRYAPTNALTREQVAAILYRYANLKGYDVSAADDLAAFADKDNISSYAVENVKWAVANKILTAVDGKLAAKDQAARSEIAVAIHAFMTTVVK